MYSVEFLSARPNGAAPYYSLVVGQPYIVGSGASCNIILHVPELPVKFANLTVERGVNANYSTWEEVSGISLEEFETKVANNVGKSKDNRNTCTKSNNCRGNYFHNAELSRNCLVVRLHVLPNVNAELVQVNGHFVADGSDVYICHNDVVSFGSVISVVFHYRPLLVCISPLDFDSAYRKDLTHMFTRLGATVINNNEEGDYGDSNISSMFECNLFACDNNEAENNRNVQHNTNMKEMQVARQMTAEPIAKFMCVKEINDTCWCLCALAYNYSLVHPTYVLEWFATLAQSASTPLSTLPAPAEYELPIRFSTNVPGTYYLRPESDNCPFSLHPISTQSLRKRNRESLFANQIFVCTDVLMMQKYATIITHCGGFVFCVEERAKLLQLIYQKDQDNTNKIREENVNYNTTSSNNNYEMLYNACDLVSGNAGVPSSSTDTNESVVYFVFNSVMERRVCEKGLHRAAPEIQRLTNALKHISYHCKSAFIGEYTFYHSLLSNRFRPALLTIPKSTLIAVNGQEIPPLALPVETVLEHQHQHQHQHQQQEQQQEEKEKQTNAQKKRVIKMDDNAPEERSINASTSTAAEVIKNDSDVALTKNDEIIKNSSSIDNNSYYGHGVNAAEVQKETYYYVPHSARTAQLSTTRYSVQITSTSARIRNTPVRAWQVNNNSNNSSCSSNNRNIKDNTVNVPRPYKIKTDIDASQHLIKAKEQEQKMELCNTNRSNTGINISHTNTADRHAGASNYNDKSLMPKTVNRTPSRSQIRSCSRNRREPSYSSLNAPFDQYNKISALLPASTRLRDETPVLNTFINGRLIKVNDNAERVNDTCISRTSSRTRVPYARLQSTSHTRSFSPNPRVDARRSVQTARVHQSRYNADDNNKRSENFNANVSAANNIHGSNKKNGSNRINRQDDNAKYIRSSSRRNFISLQNKNKNYTNSARYKVQSEEQQMSIKQIETAFDTLRIRIYAFLVRWEPRLESALSSFTRNYYVETESMEQALECAASAEEYMEKVNQLSSQPKASVYVNALRRFHDDCAALSQRARKLVRYWELRRRSTPSVSRLHARATISVNVYNKYDEELTESENYQGMHKCNYARENITPKMTPRSIDLVNNNEHTNRSSNNMERRRKHKSQEAVHLHDYGNNNNNNTSINSNNNNREEKQNIDRKLVNKVDEYRNGCSKDSQVQGTQITDELQRHHTHEHSSMYRHNYTPQTRKSHHNSEIPHATCIGLHNDDIVNGEGLTVNISVNEINEHITNETSSH